MSATAAATDRPPILRSCGKDTGSLVRVYGIDDTDMDDGGGSDDVDVDKVEFRSVVDGECLV